VAKVQAMKRQGLWRCRTLYSRVMVGPSSKARVAEVTAARITCRGPPSRHVVLPSCFLGGGLRAVRPPAPCRHEVTHPMDMTCGGKNKTLHAAACAMRSLLPFGLDREIPYRLDWIRQEGRGEYRSLSLLRSLLLGASRWL
jgi:hypothetical protein